jgi:hypothetical protein
MRYQTPQFIDIEDKLFGPFTVKQFIYLAGGAGLVFLLYRFLPLFIAIIPMVVVVGFVLALAFWKVNGKPFIIVLEAAVRFYIGEKLYLWRKVPSRQSSKQAAQKTSEAALAMPKLSEGKLRDLTWTLDTTHTTARK